MRNSIQTCILEIAFNDGSKYRVFCANRSQFERTYKAAKEKGAISFLPLVNGLHTAKQFINLKK